MNPRTQRNVQRAIHLVAGAVLALYVYAPLGAQPVFQASVRFVTVPVLVLTGFGMWLLPRWRARRRRSSAGHS